MIDKYIILNRKTGLIMKLFIYNISFLTVLVIFCINTLTYQTYFQIHSQILNLNSYFYLEVLIPAKEVNKITKQNQLWINSKKYQYKVAKIDKNITYKNNTNYIKLFLEINNLDKVFQINGYRVTIKIKKDNKKIIDYFKNKKEDIKWKI